MNGSSSQSAKVDGGAGTGSPTLGDYGFIILGCVAVILIMVAVFYFFRHSCNALRGAIVRNDESTPTPIDVRRQGLDEDTLSSYPKFTYVVQIESRKGDASSGCSICLADYRETDMLRLLPGCGHVFHVKCVDQWLLIHATCPICRKTTSPASLASAVP